MWVGVCYAREIEGSVCVGYVPLFPPPPQVAGRIVAGSSHTAFKGSYVSVCAPIGLRVHRAIIAVS